MFRFSLLTINKCSRVVARKPIHSFSSFSLVNFRRDACSNRWTSYILSINRFSPLIRPRYSEFHTSKTCNAIPPVLIALLRPVINIIAVLLGRGVRRWWHTLTPSKRKEIFEKLKRNRYKFFGGASLLPLAGYCYYELHLIEAPITKRKRFIIFSKNELIQFAEIQRKLLLEDYSRQMLPSSHYFYKRVVSVTNRLIQRNIDLPGIQDNSWTVYLINDPHQRNAFVLPDKSIFVFTGMLDVCSNDDQLAMILAHEIAHVLLSHMEENLSKAHFVQMVLLLPVLLFWMLLPNEGAILSHWLTNKVTHLMINLPFSRNIETEADQVGLQMIAKACYDVRESSKLWEKMDKLSSDESDETPIEWLSTHPSFISRKNCMDEQIPLAILLRESCQEENLSKAHFVQMVLLLPVLLFWMLLPNEGAILSHWLTNKVTHLMINLPFSRNIETEADQVGLQMIAKACYDVRESSKLWEKMDKLSSDESDETPIEWLSTHPSFISRKNCMDEQIPLAILLRESCQCPPLVSGRV